MSYNIGDLEWQRNNKNLGNNDTKIFDDLEKKNNKQIIYYFSTF